MAEVYANITGFPKYQISNHGNVKNVRTNRILKPSISGRGYLQHKLSEDGEISTKTIHKMVANAFLENPENKRCVDHQDRNRTNNNINNLRWATTIENAQNSSMKSNNISGVTGVSFHKASQKWNARIRADGRDIYLGLFENKNDAIFARQNAEIQYFGEYRNAQTI